MGSRPSHYPSDGARADPHSGGNRAPALAREASRDGLKGLSLGELCIPMAIVESVGADGDFGGQMLPSHAIANIADYALTNLKLGGQFRLGKKTGPDFKNIGIGELRGAAGRTDRIAPSSPTNAIVDIVGVCSELQMLRIAARWIVTLVTDDKAWWDWPMGQFPSDTMGMNGSSIPSGLAMAEVSPGFEPFPAVIYASTADPRPEIVGGDRSHEGNPYHGCA